MDDRRLNVFLHKLRGCARLLPRQMVQTLRGQALAGDITGAERGLERILHRMETIARAETT